MSTAYKIIQKAKKLPEQAQIVLLQMAEMLSTQDSSLKPKGKPQFGSAKGLIEIGPAFDEPLEDFKPYME